MKRLFAFAISLISVMQAAAADESIKLLFLGDQGHHVPMLRFRQLQPVMAKRGIDLVYTDSLDTLKPEVLKKYAGLIIFANHTKIEPDQEKALMEYVESGKGFIPLHCASYCFLNSPKYIDLVGAQFSKHGTGVFRVEQTKASHPILDGFDSFESWDETYSHTKHNEKDRVVLEVRKEKDQSEPWTWVRNQGKGRVFYTAWGHDERTWANPGFHSLVERGIRWACGQDLKSLPKYIDRPKMTVLAKDAPKPGEVPAKVPFYPPSKTWGVLAEPLKTMPKPLSPADSMKHHVHPVDFELKLFVDEAKLGGKPIAMNWDERGRLYVLLTMDYPNEKQPAGAGRDKVVICEDIDSDGVCDTIKVFADKLSIPTSIAFSNGGVIVHQAPETLFLKDTNGDDVADERKVIFDGWAVNDTHAGPSNLNYGLDNWFYGMVGYAGFNGEVAGKSVNFRTGFYRFKADGSKLEFLRNTNNNSWGVGFSEEGLLFGSTANGCPSVYLPIPNRYYEAVRGWSSSVLQSITLDNRYHPITEKIRQVDWHDGFTAGAGHALYTARTYPANYWNRTAFVAEPTGHLAATFELMPAGTDFRAKYGWNLFASDDEWTAPIVAEVGPDGQVWMIDWYNYIVQHNPTPNGFKNGKGNAYETELRDKTHGRIYRVVAKNGKPSPVLKLSKDQPEGLVAALKSDNMFWRRHAQRLLIERDQKDVVPQLIELVKNADVDQIGLNPAAIHALWTLDALAASDEAVKSAVAHALKHLSAGVRRNAALVIQKDAKQVSALIESKVLADQEPQVRLAALLSLAEFPSSPVAANAIIDFLNQPENLDDRWLMDAAIAAAAQHADYFLMKVGELKLLPHPKLVQLVVLVTQHYSQGKVSQSIEPLLASWTSLKPDLLRILVPALVSNWPKNSTVQNSSKIDDSLTKLIELTPTDQRSSLIRLGRALNSKSIEAKFTLVTKELERSIADATIPDNQRVDAAKQLLELTGNDLPELKLIVAQVNLRSSPTLAAGLLGAVASTNGSWPALFLEAYPGWSPSSKKPAIQALLSKPFATRLLLEAVKAGTISLDELTLDQKQGLASHPDRAIASLSKTLLAKGGSLPNADRQKVIEEMSNVIKKTGSITAGKEMYKKHCAICHVHGGEGGNVGPDLTGMAAHPKEELLIHILDPSRSVEGNFRIYQVSTLDGKQLTGLLASETKTSIEMIDAQAKKIVLQRSDIEELRASNKSLMPEGFEKQMNTEEFTNLLEFLTAKGKYVPLPLDKYATAVSTRGLFYDPEGQVERLVLPDWKPKTIEGVPFVLTDPHGDSHPNIIMLYGPTGYLPPKMPKQVTIPYAGPAKAIHFLGGVGGWNFPAIPKGSISMIVRLNYVDGTKEDHPLQNGVHFADYINRIEVPGSKFAINARGRQIRSFNIAVKGKQQLRSIELIKGSDGSAPITMAITVETE
jgi:uncharacterized protein